MSNNINFDYKNLSPFKWFVLENFPFIEADFDALTDWQLYCKLGKEINKIIDSQNLVGEQAETLTNAFNNLKNYVDNYFENLDVQEEINNKLDLMATDGTLDRIINQEIFNEINNNLTNLNQLTSTTAKHLSNLEDFTNADYDYIVAKDGTGDYNRIQDAINVATDNQTIFIKQGNYTESLKCRNKTLNLIGENKTTTFINAPTDDYYNPAIEISSGSLKNLSIFQNQDGGETHGYAIHTDFDEEYNKRLRIKNCNIFSKTSNAKGIETREGFKMYIINCEITSQGETGGAIFAHPAAGNYQGQNQELHLYNNYLNSINYSPLKFQSVSSSNNGLLIFANNNKLKTGNVDFFNKLVSVSQYNADTWNVKLDPTSAGNNDNLLNGMPLLQNSAYHRNICTFGSNAIRQVVSECIIVKNITTGVNKIDLSTYGIENLLDATWCVNTGAFTYFNEGNKNYNNGTKTLSIDSTQAGTLILTIKFISKLN